MCPAAALTVSLPFHLQSLASVAGTPTPRVTETPEIYAPLPSVDHREEDDEQLLAETLEQKEKEQKSMLLKPKNPALARLRSNTELGSIDRGRMSKAERAWLKEEQSKRQSAVLGEYRGGISAQSFSSLTRQTDSKKKDAPTTFFTPDDDEFDPVDLAVIVKACRGNRGGRGDEAHEEVNRILLNLPAEFVPAYQIKAHEFWLENSPVLNASLFSKLWSIMSAGEVDELQPSAPYLCMDKHVLDFSLTDGLLPINVLCEDTIAVLAPSKKCTFNLVDGNVDNDEFKLTVSTESATVAKAGLFRLGFELLVKRYKPYVRHVVRVDVPEGLSYFVVINLKIEPRVFAVDWEDWAMIQDRGHVVPKPMAQLRQYLYDQEALTSTGIFRLAADETEVNQIKADLNRGDFTGCRDVNTAATLLKVLFREMPVPILNCLPAAKIMTATSEPASAELYESMPEPNKRVFTWLLDVMLDVVLEPTNSMGVKATSIVISPNLVSINDPDPMKGLQLSQRAVTFVENCIRHRAMELGKTLPEN